ncbi:uncharacterized protein BO88DRAFT_402086 [Aspergillus vadensis CBS 113365]|uniref:Uncharacterized protein n=1 Tax=Aspergillus vadensis (strain CBS 113365 / IMI 142717 / IBT 24658) TaxID=1448311 RepID=A0A319BL61_ASPVC|nr:hypothetical protein BO88DRAFT_402086 [Aspergillus vadensis CBS 113365]PYH73034.1 hypothetical protein BO88DRAFT_402086 [Aspergillus vadensis CBS 113365]
MIDNSVVMRYHIAMFSGCSGSYLSDSSPRVEDDQCLMWLSQKLISFAMTTYLESSRHLSKKYSLSRPFDRQIRVRTDLASAEFRLAM